jgi:hypothetical protein
VDLGCEGVWEQKTGLRPNGIQLNRLLPYLCKNCRTSFGFGRGIVRTNMCPCRHSEYSKAENDHQQQHDITSET